MKNSLTSEQQNLLRNKYQASKWYLAVHAPRHLATAQLSSLPSGYPASSLVIGGWTGSSQLIEKDMTLWIGTSANASDVGEVRIRGDVTSSVIPIAESGSGGIGFKSGTHYVTAIENFGVWTKHIRYDTAASQWRTDYDVAHNGDLNLFKPYVNMGAPVVGVLDSGSFVASFAGGSSLFWDSPVSSQLWSFPDGQTVSSLLGTESDPVVMTFTGASPQGRYFSLQVTDANGSSAIGYRLIFVFDSLEQAENVRFGEISGGYKEGGYSAGFETFGYRTHTPYDKNEIVVFENAAYGGSQLQIGGNAPFRDNIVFRGFLVSSQPTITPYFSFVNEAAGTINVLAQQTFAYDTFFFNQTPNGASDWIQMRNLSPDRISHHLFTDRSTISKIADFYPASGIGLDGDIMLYQNLPKGSLWDQVRSNYQEKGWLAYISSDLQSSLYAFDDAGVTGLSSGQANVDIESSDMMGNVQIQKIDVDTIAQAQMFAVASDTPLGAESPAKVFGYFGRLNSIDRGLIAPDRDTLIDWTGNIRARGNSRFPSVSVPLAGNYRLDAVPQSMFSLTADVRGEAWAEKPFYLNSLILTNDQRTNAIVSSIQGEEIVDGKGGSSYDFPPDLNITYPPPPSPPPPTTPPPPPSGGGSGFGTVFWQVPDSVYRTTDLSVSSPTWTSIYDRDEAESEKFHDFILDPWEPANRAWLSTNLGLYLATGITGESPSFTAKIIWDDWEGVVVPATNIYFNSEKKVIASINVKDYVGVYFNAADATDYYMYYAYSYDAGENWSVSQVGTDPDGMFGRGGIDYVPHLINGQIVLYACASRFVGGTQGYEPVAFKSTDGGATWTELAGMSSVQSVMSLDANAEAWCVHCPYDGNEDGGEAWLGFGTEWKGSFPESSGLAHTTDGGASWAVAQFRGITPTGDYTSGFPIGIWGNLRHGVETHPQDRTRVVSYPYTDPTIAGVDFSVFLSTDAGVTWTEVVPSGVGTGANLPAGFKQVAASGGFPTNQSLLYVVNSMNGNSMTLYVSSDGGLSFVDKTGNLTGENLGIPSYINAGGTAIVPLWTE